MEDDSYAGQSASGENGVLEVAAEYTHPEGYENYYYQQQGDGEYDTSYQQESYGGYYSQQEAGYDSTFADPSQYQYNSDPNGGSYEAYDGAAGQDFGSYNVGAEYVGDQQAYGSANPETWIYSPEEGQLYLDQLTTEQTGGYYYDEEGNLIDGYGGGQSPTNVFNQEAYWESGPDTTDMSYAGETTSPPSGEGGPQDETDTEGLGLTDSSPLDSKTADGPESVATPDGKSPRKTKKADKSSRASSSPSKKKKTKKERVQMRQALLEQEEEERLKALEAAEAAGTNNNASGDGTAADAKAIKLVKKKAGLVDREKAKLQMKVRIIKAIRRNRMSVQIRILPTIRKHLSPMEKYFGSRSVECVLSDIFWASMKGNISRVRHLVEVEGDSPTDSKLDPWNLHQTPLHWAAKGGSVQVVKYLLAAGASPRSLDENGSLPLHLSCWAGHADASLVLLRASDVKDLYVQDYDGALCPLDWANVRGHTKLLKAIEKYQDSLWLPTFVEDLIRGIVRYKIKVFKDLPKKPIKEPAKEAAANAEAKPDAAASPESAIVEAEDKSPESPPDGPTKDSPSKKSFLKRATTEKVEGKLGKKTSSRSLG